MMATQSRHVAIAGLFAALLASCDGGGGGKESTYILSGTVTSIVSQVGVPNVSIDLAGTRSGSAVTDASGNYQFVDLPDGTYTVTASLPDAVFSDESRSVTLKGADVNDADFRVMYVDILATDIVVSNLAVSGNDLILTGGGDFPLKKLSVENGTTKPLAGWFNKAENVVLHGNQVYWIDSGRLNVTSLNDGTTTELTRAPRDPNAPMTADMVIDDANVFWVTAAGIQRVPLDGGLPVIVATNNRPIVDLVGDVDTLYWEEAFSEPIFDGCECGSTIKSIPKAGGTPTLLVDNRINESLPPPPPGQIPGSWLPTGGLALTDTQVVFASAAYQEYQIRVVSKMGGPVTTLASVPLAADSAIIRDIRADAARVYWLDNGNRTVATVPIAGGTVELLASDLDIPRNVEVSLEIDDSNAYWTESGQYAGCCLQAGAGRIRRVPLVGGTVSTVVSGLDSPSELVIGGGSIFWTEKWRLGQVALAGGPVATVVTGIGSGARITVHESSVYILNEDWIMKVPVAGGPIQRLGYSRAGSLGDFSQTNENIVADTDHVYWTVSPILGSPTVQKMAVTGGAAVLLSNEAEIPNPQDCKRRIAINFQNVYWSVGSTQFPVGCAIKKVPIVGGVVETVVEFPLFLDFTVDDQDLYFSHFLDTPELRNFVLRKIPVDGGAVTMVAVGAVGWLLANDSTRVYWRTERISEIAKLGAATTDAFSYPLDLSFDPFVGEALVVDPSGIYGTDTASGTIFRLR